MYFNIFQFCKAVKGACCEIWMHVLGCRNFHKLSGAGSCHEVDKRFQWTVTAVAWFVSSQLSTAMQVSLLAPTSRLRSVGDHDLDGEIVQSEYRASYKHDKPHCTDCHCFLEGHNYPEISKGST